MKYASGQGINVGDEVMVDGMIGIVVCDFDDRKFAEGFGDWDMQGVEMLGGGTLETGIMIKTVEVGLVHYEPGTGDFTLVRAFQS